MDMDKFNDCILESLTDPISGPIADFLIDHYILTFDRLARLHDGICEKTINLYFDDLHKKIEDLKKLKPKITSK